jgi:hypothetical protein
MERTIMEDMVAGRRGRSRPRRRWTQDVKKTFNMSIDEVGDLVTDRESFRQAVKERPSTKDKHQDEDDASLKNMH